LWQRELNGEGSNGKPQFSDFESALRTAWLIHHILIQLFVIKLTHHFDSRLEESEQKRSALEWIRSRVLGDSLTLASSITLSFGDLEKPFATTDDLNRELAGIDLTAALHTISSGLSTLRTRNEDLKGDLSDSRNHISALE
jgi:hypothetical protein